MNYVLQGLISKFLKRYLKDFISELLIMKGDIKLKNV